MLASPDVRRRERNALRVTSPPIIFMQILLQHNRNFISLDPLFVISHRFLTGDAFRLDTHAGQLI